MNLVSLPEGISEVKTGELEVELAKEDPKFLLVDARPVSKYNEEHIPGAVSIPYTHLKDKGAELLPAEKDAAMVFYCGGPT
jgi:rhodanese-related sulfurtransferase